MHKLRILTVGLGALALGTVAAAQFDGPAPLAWRFIQPTKNSPGGSPLVVGERIYQSVGGRIFSIDRESGNLKFRFPAIDPIPGVFRTSPVLAPGGVVAAVGDNKIVYGFDAEKGDLKWSYSLPTAAFGQPAVVGKYVIVATGDNKLYAIDAEKGEAAWTGPFNVYDGINGQIAPYKGSLIFFTGRNELVSLNVGSLRYDWKRALSTVPPGAVPVIYGEDIFLNSGPYLVQVNATTGIPKWQVATGLTLTQSPAVSASGVLVLSQDGKAKFYDPLTRTELTKKPIELGSVAINRATPVGSKFVVPTGAGGFVLVDPLAGSVLWNYIIRPLGKITSGGSSSGTRPGGPGGPGGGGGFGGGGFGGGQGGPGQNSNNNDEPPATIQAAAPPVLAGTTLIIPAKDGSILAFDKTTGVDLTAPKVDLLFPNPGDQVAGVPPLLFVFRLEDIASGVKDDSLKIEIGGVPYEHQVTKDGRIIVRITETGKNKPLSDGRKEVVVTVSDWLGNVRVQKYAFMIDNTLRPITLPGSDKNNPNNPGGRPGGFGGGRGGGNGGGEGN